MATTVTMPQLGETVTEGTILRWLKRPGDTISEDEVLVEISTDKVDTEVPSPVSGVILEILAEEGQTVPVGTPIAVIGEPGEAPAGETAPQPEAEPAPAPAEPAPSEAAPTQPAPASAQAAATPPPPEATPEPSPEVAATGATTPVADAAAAASVAAAAPKPVGGEVDAKRFLSPVVRKLAKEHGIDLSQVKGTGRGGRITRNDVLRYLEEREKAAAAAPVAAPAQPAAPAAAPAQPAAPVAPAAPAAPAAAAAPVPAEPVEIPLLPGDEVVELDRLRVRIAENMIRSKRTAAHVWASVEVDYERVERVRRAHKEAFKAREGFSLTYLPFIARATIDALKAYPVVNSSFYLEHRKAVFHKQINLGIAVDLDQKGLLVVTVRDADEYRLVGLARKIRELAQKARDGKLEPADISGSTFTITNPGPFGSYLTAPIINLPNVAILSTDTVTKRPAVVAGPDGEDVIAIRHIGYLGFTWDHRAFDGSTAVLFLRRIKENLETWDWEQELGG